MKRSRRLLLITLLPLTCCAHSVLQLPEETSAETSLDSDERPYCVVPGWAAGDNTAPTPAVGTTHGGVVVDKDGLIYVSSSQGIYVFNDAGDLVNSLLGQSYANIHALVIAEESGEEFLYAARNNSAEAIKFKTSGAIVLRLKFPSDAGVTGAFRPTAVAVKPNGNILVADGYGTNMIYEFDREGSYLSHFGGRNETATHKFKTPHGLTLDTRYEPARLLVADREKRRLVHFTLEGEFIEEVITGLRRPCAVSISNQGLVAIAELEGRVALLDSDNKLMGVLGDNPNKADWANFKVPVEGWKEGIFTAPHGLSWDHQGNLYVQDWNQTGRVTKWVKP